MRSAASDQQTTAPVRIIHFERGFCRPRRKKPVHGVELARLHMLRDLAEMPVQITTLAEASWEPRICEAAGDSIEIVTAPYVFRARPTAWLLSRKALALARQRGAFDLAMLGDPNPRQLGAVRTLMRGDVSRRALIMAHGRGRVPMLEKLRDRCFDVHANSAHVAEEFRGRIRGRLTVSYGIVNAQDFLSRTPVYDQRREPGAPVRFCLLARLPSTSKGEGVAREAFALLPSGLRERAELHLAGYLEPPAESAGSRITVYPWIGVDDVPSWLASMDVMLVPSTNESFCQSMVQAMLVGLPCLTSTLDVLTEKLVEGGDRSAAGVACEGAGELAAAMRRMIEEPETRARMGQAARRIAQGRYVFDTAKWAREVLLNPSP